MYLVTTVTSLLSAAFGMAKFLKTGPCRLVSNDGLLGGYFQLGFILNFMYILSLIFTRSSLSFIPLIFGKIYLTVATYGITFIHVSTYSLNRFYKCISKMKVSLSHHYLINDYVGYPWYQILLPTNSCKTF